MHVDCLRNCRYFSPLLDGAIVPSVAMLSVAVVPPSPAASRHPVCVPFQTILEIRRQDLLNGSTDVGAQFKTSCEQRQLQLPRHRTADDDVHPQLLQHIDKILRISLSQPKLVPIRHATVCYICDQDVSGNVQHRRNPVLPLWDGNLHTLGGALFVPLSQMACPGA